MSISGEQEFLNKFSKYTNQKDKFESLYIFVIYKLSFLDTIAKILKIINSIDLIPDVKRKYYLKNRMNNFLEYIKINFVPESLVNGIYLLDSNVNYEPMDKYYIETLELFSHNNFSYKYDNEYNINWLKDLVLNRNYINVIKVKNNDITHIKLNSSKKNTVLSQTIKSLNLEQYIQLQIPKSEQYIIHGISVCLKNFTDKNAMHISNSELTDEEILKIYLSDHIKRTQKELSAVLDNMSDTKFYNKMVFGKEIKLAIQNSMLETLYCTKTINDSMNKIPNHLKNFNIKIVHQLEKADIGEKLEKEYSGAIGIKYY